MKPKYTLRARIAAYAMLLLAVIASVFLLMYVYIIKSAFQFPAYGSVSFEPAAGAKAFADGKMLITTNVDSLNAILNGRFSGAKEEEGVSPVLPADVYIDGLYCYFKETGGDTDKLYINISKFNIIFSFICDFAYSINDGTVNIELGNIRLGRYGLPAGRCVWRLLGVPENVSFAAERQELLYLSGLKISGDGLATLIYDYDRSLLTQALNEILAEADERKIEFHSGKKDVPESLISIAKRKSVTQEEALALVTDMEKRPETFLSLCLLLNETGIRGFQETFGESYYKYLDADRLVETSDDAINSDLNIFSKKFARLLLEFLYKNLDYEIRDGRLYVNGNVVSPETVLSAEDDESVYDIEIIADESGIAVKFGIMGYETEKKVILGE